ncbi:MAG: hypothetical protein ABIO55_12790 [Ginsengibacter sp.]
MARLSIQQLFDNDSHGLKECLNISLVQFNDLLLKVDEVFSNSNLVDIATSCHQLSFISSYLDLSDLKELLLTMEEACSSDKITNTKEFEMLKINILQKIPIAIQKIELLKTVH